MHFGKPKTLDAQSPKETKRAFVQKTVSAVGRLNNSLPLFPIGSVADKFSAAEILRLTRLREGSLGNLGMEAIPRKLQYLTAILPLVEEKPDDEHAAERISFQLKMRVGTGASTATYNISVQRLNEGSVHQWIVFRQNLDEIWTQNGVLTVQRIG